MTRATITGIRCFLWAFIAGCWLVLLARDFTALRAVGFAVAVALVVSLALDLRGRGASESRGAET